MAAEALVKAQAAKVAQVSFKDTAKGYIAGNEDSWRNAKHRQQWRNTLDSYVYPEIGDMPVGEIETAHVLRIIEPIWKTKPETASRIRGRIETVLDSAKARGFRKGENPDRWRGHLAQILPARTKLSRGHHKAMPYTEIPSFVCDLRAREAVAALALEFVILTAARSGEVIGATWREVDLDAAVWAIPAERMKAATEHRVPLSPRAVEILESLKPIGSNYLFPGAKGGKLSGMAMAMLLRRMKTDATVHGFRSGFRDWAAEQTAYAHEVAEMALAQGFADVQTLGGQRPLSLYTLTVARSGERKSACDAPFMQALGDHEREQSKTYAADKQRWGNEHAVWKASHDRIVQDARKSKGSDNTAAVANLQALGPEPVAPAAPDRTVTEPSFEGLTKLFAFGQPSLGLFSDEGGQFLGGHAMNNESRQKTLAAFNDLWQGKPIRRTRSGDGHLTLFGRRLAIHLMVQPTVARGFMADPLASDTGFLARFLLYEPQSTIGTRFYETSQTDNRAIDAFRARLRQILAAEMPMVSET